MVNKYVVENPTNREAEFKAIITLVGGKKFGISNNCYIDKDFSARLYKIKVGNTGRESQPVVEFPFYNVEYVEYIN